MLGWDVDASYDHWEWQVCFLATWGWQLYIRFYLEMTFKNENIESSKSGFKQIENKYWNTLSKHASEGHLYACGTSQPPNGVEEVQVGQRKERDVLAVGRVVAVLHAHVVQRLDRGWQQLLLEWSKAKEWTFLEESMQGAWGDGPGVLMQTGQQRLRLPTRTTMVPFRYLYRKKEIFF